MLKTRFWFAESGFLFKEPQSSVIQIPGEKDKIGDTILEGAVNYVRIFVT